MTHPDDSGTNKPYATSREALGGEGPARDTENDYWDDEELCDEQLPYKCGFGCPEWMGDGLCMVQMRGNPPWDS